jgi:hypothetical protein
MTRSYHFSENFFVLREVAVRPGQAPTMCLALCNLLKSHPSTLVWVLLLQKPALA